MYENVDTYPRLLEKSRGGRGNRALPTIGPVKLADTSPDDVPSRWPLNDYSKEWLEKKKCRAEGGLLASEQEDLPQLEQQRSGSWEDGHDAWVQEEPQPPQ